MVAHGFWEGTSMRRKARNKKLAQPKTKLALLDLEHAKTAVLVSLRSPESQRSYRRSIDEFVHWYCSEPRLSFNKTVVTRYRIHLEDRQLAPGTINVGLAAVRRLAYEAADTCLLSPDLAAGIRRVKGAKKLGMKLGNWLTLTEARNLWQLPNPHTLKGKRDRAMLAVLLGCGLRRSELHGKLFRCVCRKGTVWGTEVTEKVVWGERVCRTTRNSQTGAARSQEILCPVVSRFRRGTHTNSIPAGTRLRTDHREIPGMQATTPWSS